MILDLQTIFSGSYSAAGVLTGQALTATAISTNVLDLRQAATPATVDESAMSPVADLWLVVQTDASAAFASAGASTLVITVETDTAVGLATANVVHLTSPTIAKASMTASTVLWKTKLPSDSYKRYMGLRYTVGTANFTAGGIVAFLTPNLQRNIVYPAGFTIDV